MAGSKLYRSSDSDEIRSVLILLRWSSQHRLANSAVVRSYSDPERTQLGRRADAVLSFPHYGADSHVPSV